VAAGDITFDGKFGDLDIDTTAGNVELCTRRTGSWS